MHLQSSFQVVPLRIRQAALAMSLACVASMAFAVLGARVSTARMTARLNSAAQRLDALTQTAPMDDDLRAAIAWGYSERLRLGLESPFRLVEAASQDPRLTEGERRTVSWALLARVLRAETHEIDPSALDLVGPWEGTRSASGEQHVALIDRAITRSEDPRAAELAVRFAYTLASAERLVEGSAPLLAAEVAALIADREIAQREAWAVVRSAARRDPIAVVRRRRAARALYVERPVLLAPTRELEQEGAAMVAALLDSLRTMRPLPLVAAPVDSMDLRNDGRHTRLLDAGRNQPPAAPLVVTVQRYLPAIRAQATRIAAPLARVHNGEMLVAAVRLIDASRAERRVTSRMLLAAAVSMRSLAQERVWFDGDTTMSVDKAMVTLGLAGIEFDRDVRPSWQPYYLSSLTDGIRDLHRVMPELRLTGLHVRFRATAPADSALAMHDPRTRTLHLPVLTAAGTLVHELAHDLDRQSARQQGLTGYRSDIVARTQQTTAVANGRLAASIQALSDELAELTRGSRMRADRPAEVFATRVDWFVATALAREGVSNAFLSAAQDELLTGHVIHPERLRASGRSRALVTALEGMTTVAPSATIEQEPSTQTLLRWSLAAPVDRRVASEIVRGQAVAWSPGSLVALQACHAANGRAALLRLAAESRARGWLHQRARWAGESERPGWARSALGQSPWSDSLAERRVAQLRDYILLQLATSAEFPTGIDAYAAPLVAQARCAA